MSTPFVAILMGSDSDLPTMQTTLDTLEKLGVPYEVKITSAHRTPEATHNYVTDADQRGCAAFIGAARPASQILALGDPELAERVKQERANNAAMVIAKDAELQAKLG